MTRAEVVLLGVLAGAATSCRARSGPQAPPEPGAGNAPAEVRDVRCVERPEGCIWCEGHAGALPLLDAEDRPEICSPKNADDCIAFCSKLTPDCALPWRGGTGCVLPSDDEFRRALYWRDHADKPEAVLLGRVVDEAGKRLEGAKVRVWAERTALADEVSGKDGLFRISLRAASQPFSVRITHPGHATEITEVRLPGPMMAEKGEKQAALPRLFRLGPETLVRGHVVTEEGQPLGDVTVQAAREPEDFIDVAEAHTGEDGSFTLGGLEARKYFLRPARFGWRLAGGKAVVVAPAARVTMKMAPTGVLRGTVVDADGEPEPHATVVAAPAGGMGAPSSPIVWTVDAKGKFAEDRIPPGTYYVSARRGDMVAYPPARVEIDEETLERDLDLRLSHRGARVTGRVVPREGFVIGEDTRVVLGSNGAIFPRQPAGEVAHDGRFVATGVLPGRYDISVRGGGKGLGIARGPREVEVPIEPGATVDLGEPIVVRPPMED